MNLCAGSVLVVLWLFTCQSANLVSPLGRICCNRIFHAHQQRERPPIKIQELHEFLGPVRTGICAHAPNVG